MPHVAQHRTTRSVSGALRSIGRALRRSGQGLLALARCADLWRALRR
ncbi:hypothetical protein A2U01_0116286, partial [Trifolium medium]|nr:hypothetical protein [Trifolium medium]